jgi:hypothetical protein
MPGHSWPFGDCTVAIIAEQLRYGDPPAGYVWRCKSGGAPEPVGFFSVVYAAKVPTTYLLQTVHERSGAYVDDVEVTTTHWRWDTSGDPGDTDFALVESRMDDFWTAVAYLRTTGIAVRDHRWYVADPAPGPPNPSIRVTPVNIPGTSTAKPLPPQCAITLTQITDNRRRWGRFYIGGLTTDTLGTGSGRVLNDQVDAIAAAAGEAFFNSAAHWRIQVFGGSSPASLPVRSVRCDDIFDVQRRRRNDLAFHRATVTLDA